MAACECPVIWHGIFPPPCPVHNPTPQTYTARTICESCGALVGDSAKHEQWHDAQARTARDAALGAMSMRPIGGLR